MLKNLGGRSAHMLLVYPDYTALWEEQLQLMSEGKEELQKFLGTQIEFVTHLVKQAGVGIHQNRLICPKCGTGYLIKRKGKFGYFYGCTAYPNCKYTKNADGENGTGGMQETSDYKCPRCASGYFVRQGRQWVCNAYPQCNTKCADKDGKPSIFAN